MAHDSDDTIGNSDHLDDLLKGFKSRNEFRSDPNYVLEPVDVETPITDRFVKILRTTSLNPEAANLVAEESPIEPETNSGLIMLAENYEKSSRKKLANSRVFTAIAGVLLFASAVSFAALAGYVLAGMGIALAAAIFLVLSRTSDKQAEEFQKLASELVQPEQKN